MGVTNNFLLDTKEGPQLLQMFTFLTKLSYLFQTIECWHDFSNIDRHQHHVSTNSIHLCNYYTVHSHNWAILYLTTLTGKYDNINVQNFHLQCILEGVSKKQFLLGFYSGFFLKMSANLIVRQENVYIIKNKVFNVDSSIILTQLMCTFCVFPPIFFI